jgi:Zn-dependent peptidase ImmA (M78 family)/transcriptional regulator with XRE-family HTH domain
MFLRKKMASQVNPRMLVLGREARALTQSELAARLGVQQGTISKLESGVSTCTDELLHGYSEELDLPRSFFQQETYLHGSGTDAFHQMYRRRSALSSKQLKCIEANVNIVRMHCQRLMAAVDWDPGIGIPKLKLGEFRNDPQLIAQAVRAAWQLPSGPIENVTQAIEDAGGYVIPMEFGTALIDATSIRLPDLPPLIFYNRNLKGDRLRFSLAHELAHLVMHWEAPSAAMEEQADEFAAEFLMPAAEIASQLVRLDLRRAALLKPAWKVSMSALVVRAKQLGKLTPNQYRHLMATMSAAGMRTREPAELDIAVESPRFHKQMIDYHLNTLGYSLEEICSLLDCSELDALRLHGIARPSQALRLVKIAA